MKISDDVRYIGVDDTTLDLFESQYKIPEGVSYNSYLILDEKIAVMDTVDKRKTEEWLANLKRELGGKTPDYLVISHMEPDHSASVAALIKEYPSINVVGNQKTFTIAERFFGNIFPVRTTVKDGETLSLGKHSLTFIFAPMIHWPEVMVSYEATEKILFSADAFGKFGIPSAEADWDDEARRYYINIVGKYGNMVQQLLKKASMLEIAAICPLHGPVLKGDLSHYLEKYDVWSSYRPEEKGTFIACASIHGHTKEAMLQLKAILEEKGEKTIFCDLTREDLAAAVANAFRFDKSIFAACTYDAGLFPPMEDFLNHLKAKNFQNRKIALVENGSWAPFAGKIMRTTLESMKNLQLGETLTIPSALHDESALVCFAENFLKN